MALRVRPPPPPALVPVGCRLWMEDIGTPREGGGYSENWVTDLVCSLWSLQESKPNNEEARCRLASNGLFLQTAFVESNCSHETQNLLWREFCSAHQRRLHGAPRFVLSERVYMQDGERV